MITENVGSVPIGATASVTQCFARQCEQTDRLGFFGKPMTEDSVLMGAPVGTSTHALQQPRNLVPLSQLNHHIASHVHVKACHVILKTSVVACKQCYAVHCGKARLGRKR